MKIRILKMGGNLLTNGGDFPTGLTHINTGGTHEDSPYLGVPMGLDSNGTPNLVEENETIYNDYVFSDRLTVPEISKPSNGEEFLQWEKVLKKYQGKTFAEASKKAEKDSGVDERPNDPIARRGFESVLEILAQSQEWVRAIENNPEQAELIASMSPEEYAEQKAQLELQLMALQLAMMELIQALLALLLSPELQAIMQQLAMQQLQMSPEEQAMVQQQMMAQLGAQPLMACGGRLHAEGGELSSEEQTAMTLQEVPPTELVPEDSELSIPPGTEETPSAEISQFNAGTPAEEMSTKELNETIDEIYQYAKDNKDKDLLRRARKAKRGTREDKEEFVEDAREDIQMAIEELELQLQAQAELKALEQVAMEQLQLAEMLAVQADAGAELDAQDGGANEFALGGQMSLDNTLGGQNNEEGKLYAGPEVDIEDNIKEINVKALDRQYKKRGIDPAKLIGKAREQYEKDKVTYIANKDKKGYDIDGDKSLSINSYSKDERKYNTQLFNAISNGAVRTKSSGKGVAWEPIKGYEYIDGANADYWNDNTHYNDAGGLYDYKDNIPTEWYQKYNIDKYLADMKAGDFTPAKTSGNIPSKKDSRTAAKTIEKDPTYQAFWKDLTDNWDSDKALQIRKALAAYTGKDYDDITKEYAKKQATTGNVGYFHTPVKASSNTPTGTRYRYTDNLGTSHWIRKPEDGFTEKSRTNSTVNGVNMTDIDVEPINANRYLTKIGNTIVDVTNMEDSPYTKNITRVANDDVSTLGNGVNPTTTWVGLDNEENDSFPRIPLAGMIGGLGTLLTATLGNILNPIDYTNAEGLKNAFKITPERVGFKPIGDKMEYTPVDIGYMAQLINSQGRANAADLMNIASGNALAKAANLLANAYNTQVGLGQAYLNAYKENMDRLQKVAEFNRNTNQYNSEGLLKSDMANLDATMKAKTLGLLGIDKSYAMRQALENAKGLAINNSLTGLINQYNNIINTKYQNELLNWKLKHNYNPISLLEK